MPPHRALVRQETMDAARLEQLQGIRASNWKTSNRATTRPCAGANAAQATDIDQPEQRETATVATPEHRNGQEADNQRRTLLRRGDVHRSERLHRPTRYTRLQLRAHRPVGAPRRFRQHGTDPRRRPSRHRLPPWACALTACPPTPTSTARPMPEATAAYAPATRTGCRRHPRCLRDGPAHPALCRRHAGRAPPCQPPATGTTVYTPCPWPTSCPPTA